jgi:hypothetical protein
MIAVFVTSFITFNPMLHLDLDLDIDQNTGEIRTKVVLDRELRSSYHLSAIPLSGDGENIKVHFYKLKFKFKLNT